jgi:hypothetical protein
MSAFMGVSSDHELTLIERGTGVHLNHPLTAQSGDPRFVTRSMGVTDTSPLRPAEGRQRGVRTSRRAHPNCLEWAQARGLDARLHLLGMHQTQANVDTCAWHHRGRLKHCQCQLKLTPRKLTNPVKKPCRSTHSPARLRGLHPRVC